MQQRILILVTLGILLSLTEARAQFFKPKPKETDSTALEEEMAMREALDIQVPQLKFKYVNHYPYYYNKRKMSLINKYKREKDWERLFPVLYEYVSLFGPENFIEDIGLIWDLARLSEHFKYDELKIELYRLLLKHHRTHDRGEINVPPAIVDSLKNAKKEEYVTLDKFYEMVERWELVDTLRPPNMDGADMGESINSEFEDYGLAIDQNDQRLFFTSKRSQKKGLNSSTEEKKIVPESPNEDIYVSEKLEDGWSAAKSFKLINTEYNEGSPAISPDGKTLVFARCYSPDGYGNCDLFMSVWLDKYNTWSEAVNLGETVNTASWDSHPTFSTSGDTLFFASDRQGGFGGSDIYFSIRDKYDNWTYAANIGPIVNTKRNEVSPFIHTRYGVMYYSSDGQLVNFGNYDIFKTYYRDSTWSEPKNLGPFVNGKGDEYYFSIDNTAETLYYSKTQNEESKNSDLYSFPLPMEAKPFAKVKFTGRIFEKTTGAVFDGTVAIFDMEEKVPIAPKKIGEDGRFEFRLVNKRKYMIIVSGENFFRIKDIFFLDGETHFDIPAQTIQSLRFESVEFEAGSAVIREEMRNDLHLVIDFLKEHTDFNLAIEGHTDGSGTETTNLKLSQERADAIRKYLIDYGPIPEEQVSAKGYGSSKRIIENEITEADKQLNRRVEFKLFKKTTEEESEDVKDEDETPKDLPRPPGGKPDEGKDKSDIGGWE